MERSPLHNLSHDDLVRVVLQMQMQMQLAVQAKRIEDLEDELRELRK